MALRGRLSRFSQRPLLLCLGACLLLGGLPAEPDKDIRGDAAGALGASPLGQTVPKPSPPGLDKAKPTPPGLDKPKPTPPGLAKPKPTPPGRVAAGAPSPGKRFGEASPLPGGEAQAATGHGPWKPIQELESSLRARDLPEEYSERLPEILDLMEPAAGAGIPPSLLAKRVREAATKGVGVDRALDAFSHDAENLLYLAKRSRETSWPPVREGPAFFEDAAAALRSGVGRASLDCLFHLADVSRPDARKAAASLTTVAALRKELDADEYQAAALCAALTVSKLGARDIPRVLDLARSWLASGGTAADFQAQLILALRAGQSLRGLQKRLAKP